MAATLNRMVKDNTAIPDGSGELKSAAGGGRYDEGFIIGNGLTQMIVLPQKRVGLLSATQRRITADDVTSLAGWKNKRQLRNRYSRFQRRYGLQQQPMCRKGDLLSFSLTGKITIPPGKRCAASLHDHRWKVGARSLAGSEYQWAACR
ncbi:hypothetical protein HHJ39_00090 [Escherichia coli]|nr:hypothetical protein HHJ39_00090 [Escherichia coli]